MCEYGRLAVSTQLPMSGTRLGCLVISAALVLGLAPGCAGRKNAKAAADLKRDLDFAMRSARAGLWNEALFRWERALPLRPDDAHLLNNLAVAYEHEGRYEDARDAYHQALELEPENDHIRKNAEAFDNFFDRHTRSEDDEAPDGEGERTASSHEDPDGGDA